jgi:hypothetical protein
MRLRRNLLWALWESWHRTHPFVGKRRATMTGSSVGVNSSSAATTPGIDDSMTMSTAILLPPVWGGLIAIYGSR